MILFFGGRRENKQVELTKDGWFLLRNNWSSDRNHSAMKNASRHETL